MFFLFVFFHVMSAIVTFQEEWENCSGKLRLVGSAAPQHEGGACL